MHHSTLKSSLTAFLFLVGATACTTEKPATPAKPGADQLANTKSEGATQEATSKPSQPHDQPTAGQVPAAAMQVWKGKILETMNSGSYSYIHMDMAGKKIWVAGPQKPGLGVGQEVSMSPGMLMANFESPTLNRTFPEIYFVGAIDGGAQAPAPAKAGGGLDRSDDANPNTKVAGTPDKIEGIAKVEGGYTVEEILTKTAELKGKKVKVRGRVVKFSAQIMGTNFAHIQDGTGSGKTADLTVTSKTMMKVGELVVVEGTSIADKDFGMGYRYAAIVENATVTKQP